MKHKLSPIGQMAKQTLRNSAFILLAPFAVWVILYLLSFIFESAGNPNPHYDQVISVELMQFIASHLENALVIFVIAATLPTVAQVDKE